VHPDTARELKMRILEFLHARPGAQATGRRPWVAVGLAPAGGGRARVAVRLEEPADAALLPDLGPALSRLSAAAPPGSYLDEPVVPELVDHLATDWPYPADKITIVDGAMDALDLVTRCFVRFGERVAVENPCFPPLLDLLEAAGAEVVPVDLDAAGERLESVAAAVAAGARTLYLQPRAQNPTGASLTGHRARALAELLEGTTTLVVEDDSAGAALGGETDDATDPQGRAVIVLEDAGEDEVAEFQVFRPAKTRAFEVERVGEHEFRVTGDAVDRLIARHDLENDEALAHVENRLRRMGVIAALEAKGFEPGDDVELGGVVFELDPS